MAFKLQPRIRDVLVIAPIPLIMLIISSWTTALLFGVVGFLAIWELRWIICKTRENFYTLGTRIALGAVIASLLGAMVHVGLGALIAIASSLWIYSYEGRVRCKNLAVGQLIVSLTVVLGYWVRSWSPSDVLPYGGLSVIILALVVTAFSDSGAYFVGKAVGRRKFAPVISPNKTWEGVMGGWLFGILGAYLFASWFIPTIVDGRFFVFALAFLLITFAGQMGDLMESALKRNYEVKDSGTVLRSHGGILDRFDSLGLVLPLTVLFVFLAIHV